MSNDARTDWRRVGVVVPSSNTTVEADFARSLPPGVTLHAARMYLAETTVEAERQMLLHHVPAAVRDLASLRPHVVAFACTSAAAVLGPEGEAALIADIARQTGAPVVSTNSAVGAAIARHRPQRVAVLTPYIDALNQAIRAGLEQRGLPVVHIAGLGITDNFGICEVTPAEIVAFAERELAGKAFDLLFVSCTNFRALEARPALLARFGVPVVTSNQATIEATLAAIGCTPVSQDVLG
ncbi:MAG TPA: Asp/Glu racemase [Chloroflexota bacterium]|jgi:maleate isomerase|nr:Asp/Glu racemase [Chloroflexota bacterium]